MKIKIIETMDTKYRYQFLGWGFFNSEPIVEVVIQNKKDISKSGNKSSLYKYLELAAINIPINAIRKPIRPMFFLIISHLVLWIKYMK